MKSKCVLGLLLISLFLAFTNIDEVNAAEKYSIKIDVTSANYGAKPDTDSTKAIQKALDKAASVGGKKRALVTIPKGTYYISSSLRIGSNTHLKCSDKTVIKKISTECLYMLRSQPGEKGGYSAVENITIEGGTYDADFLVYNENSGGTLLFFSHVNNLTIKNVTLKNNLGTHLIELAGAKSVTITGCELHGFKYSAAKQAKEAIQLDVTHDDNITPDAAPYDDTPCCDITISNNNIYDYPRAIGSHSAVKGIYHDNITIKNNKIHDISGTAIYAYNYTGLNVENNKMTDVGTGIAIKTFAASAPKTLYTRNPDVPATKLKDNNFDITIADNTITTITGEDEEDSGGMGIFIYATTDYPMSGCKITGNELTTHSSGIYLRYISNADIFENTLARPAKVFKTAATDFAEDAIKLLTTVSCNISKNTISATGQAFENGIALRDDSTNVSIDGNIISKPDKTGIALYDSSVASLSGNEVKSSGKHGITATNNCTVKMENNQISDSGENGITIQSASIADISNGNVISGSTKNGVSVTKDSTVSIVNNTIRDNKGIGILVNSSIPEQISGNDIIYNKQKGLSIQSVKSGSISNNNLCNKAAKWEVTLTKCKLSGLLNMYSVQSVTATAGTNIVSGIANKGTNIYVKVNNNEYNLYSPKRNFSIPTSTLKAGDNITVYVKDASGNKAYYECTVK